MSLAFYAAPINEPFQENNTEKPKKKKNRTIKRERTFDNSKIDSILSKIHDNPNNDNNNDLGDFNPLTPPEQTNQNNYIEVSNNEDNVDNQEEAKNGFESFEPNNPMMIAENFEKLNNSYSNNNLNSIIPYYNNISEPSTSKDILVKKLNYLIYLLEEQRDSKTEHVTEELILYSFLGVFVIFIIDSFARVGKYVR